MSLLLAGNDKPALRAVLALLWKSMRHLVPALAVALALALSSCNCGEGAGGEADAQGSGLTDGHVALDSGPAIASDASEPGADASIVPPPVSDGGAHSHDAALVVDSGQLQGEPDAASAAGPDASTAAAGLDAAAPAGPTEVDIFIDNSCNTSVVPSSIDAPLDSQLMLEFHNRSVDYEADVWSSRNYGYLELAIGGVWGDPVTHCDGPSPYDEYFDISIAGGGGTACPGVRLEIHCQ
jgi:predicted small secreted protein